MSVYFPTSCDAFERRTLTCHINLFVRATQSGEGKAERNGQARFAGDSVMLAISTDKKNAKQHDKKDPLASSSTPSLSAELGSPSTDRG